MIIFDKALAANNAANLRAMTSQYADVTAQRKDPRYRLPLLGNAGVKPGQLYQEFDDNVTTQFRLDEGDVILNMLMPLARSLPIGSTVLKNARASDSGTFQQSMTGEQGTIYDGLDYDLDGTIVPIGQNGFKTPWREGQQLSLENFDDLSHKNREGIRTHRQGVIGSFMDGHKDNNGVFIVEDGLSWQGVRNDARVDQIDLGAGGLNFDFTSAVTTGPDYYEAFKSLSERRQTVQFVLDSCEWFVSPEIFWQMQRQYGSNDTQGVIMTQLMTIPGVGSIQQSSVLTGNQILSMPMQSRFVQPVVGMGVSTIARSRPEWNSPMAFDIVSAIGWKVVTDFENAHLAVQYASS